MTSEKMQELADNMKMDNPNMRLMQELFVYLADRETERLKYIEACKKSRDDDESYCL